MSQPADSWPPAASPLGDACLCWSFGQELDEATSARVLAAYQRLRARPLPGVHDLVPAYNSLALHFDPLLTEAATLAAQVAEVLAAPGEPAASQPPAHHRVPVRYDGPDLAELAAAKGLTPAELARRHAAGRYRVAMIGFRPHFPYLLGLDPSLATPRRASPRSRVPAGSVAIGGQQTGIYPEDSPGGWHLLGHTDPAGLRALRPGDWVTFEPVGAP